MSNDLAVDIRSRLLRCLTPAEAHADRLPDSLSEPADAVFFDLDGVLYDHTCWRRWLLQLLGRMGLHTNYTAFFRLWDCEYGDDVAWGRIPYWNAMRTFLISAGMSACQADEVEGAGRARFREAEQHVRPFPGVLLALRQLAIRKLQLNLIAASPLTREQLQGKLNRLGMSSCFAHTGSARDWPPGTPTQQRLASAITSAHQFPAHTVYVGRLKSELQAAAQLGMQTVAFNPEPDAIAHYHLDRFDFLPRMIPTADMPMLAAG